MRIIVIRETEKEIDRENGWKVNNWKVYIKDDNTPFGMRAYLFEHYHEAQSFVATKVAEDPHAVVEFE